MKAQLKDVVFAVAVWSLAVDQDGNANIVYQKELVDDAPGTANDEVLDVGVLKTIACTPEQSKQISDAISSVVESFINDAEAASGTPPQPPADQQTDNEPPADEGPSIL